MKWDVTQTSVVAIFEFITPKLCKIKRKIIWAQMSSKVQCFIFQPMLNTHIFKKGCNNLALKNLYVMYKSKYHSVLSIYMHTSGFRKHKSYIDMAKNYVLSGRFHWPWQLACFVVDFNYFEKKNMFNVFPEITLQSSCNTSLERKFNYFLLWHIACVDWWTRKATTDICVTPPPNFNQVMEIGGM